MFVDSIRPERVVESQCVAGCAPFTVRGDRNSSPSFSEQLPESHDAGRMNAIIIGKENHRVHSISS
jgi:hypothetical protein